MFQEPEPRVRPRPTAIVVAVVLLAVSLLYVLKARHTTPPPAVHETAASVAYAPNLLLSDLQMSESTSFSGGKETFVDGRITNKGQGTVTGATVRVSFPSDGGTPQLETVPVTLIRTREPYIDVQPLSAAALAPGAAAEFRLTFDDIRPDWNQQVPVVQVIGVTLR